MAELARGTTADRPWGRTLAALAQRGFSGQLNLAAEGKRYAIAFADGAVAGATSPLAIDAAVRVAMTSGLLSSTQVSEIVRRQAAAPQRDEIEVLAEAIRLAPDQTLRLRRRTIAQRAARTFAVERGDFTLEDHYTLPIISGSELDVRGVVYYGARQNFSDGRLATELAHLGSWFRIRPDAVADLPQFGFGNDPGEPPVIERLRSGASIGELEQLGIEQRLVRAIVYALAACGACEVDPHVSHPARAVPAMTAAAADGSSRTLATHQTSAAGSGAIKQHAIPATQTPRVPASSSAPATARRQVQGDPARAEEVRGIVAQRAKMLQGHADHYSLLGVKSDASPEEIRTAYFALARKLHPDRLAAIGLVDDSGDAHRVMSHVNTAFGVLSDPARRAEYTDILRRGGEAAIKAEQDRAEQLVQRALEAEDAFRRGEMLLRRDQLVAAANEFARAVQLDPDAADYQALHAWARFLASEDRVAVANTTRRDLELAISKSPRAVAPRFYLGRVARMLGRDNDALKLFQEVLQLVPHHSEAASEIRVIEQRLGVTRKR